MGWGACSLYSKLAIFPFHHPRSLRSNRNELPETAPFNHSVEIWRLDQSGCIIPTLPASSSNPKRTQNLATHRPGDR